MIKISWLRRYLLQWKGPSTLGVTVTSTPVGDEEDNDGDASEDDGDASEDNGDASEDIDANADSDISDIYASKSELQPVDAIDSEIDLGSNCDHDGSDE